MITKQLKTAVVLCSLLFALKAACQPSQRYFAMAKVAKTHFNAGNYDSAAYYFTQAIWLPGGFMRKDGYTAAQAYAMAGNADSAFARLNALARTEWDKYDSIIGDKYLVSLHTDERWKGLCEQIKINAGLDDTKINKYARTILDSVLKDDQEGRNKLVATEKSFGRNSAEYKALLTDIREKDSIDVLKVTEIIDSFGWLGKVDVGGHANIAEFLVIQHASPQVQKKYLPVMQQAVKDGKLNSSYFAMLQDRILISEGKDQMYGTQIAESKDGESFIEPLQDPDNVDARRRSVGLGPLSTYVKEWKITWDPIIYKHNLKRYRRWEQELNEKK